MPVIIGVDGNDANVEKKVGVSMYTIELLREFQRLSNNTTSFIVYLKDEPRQDLPRATTFFTYKVVPGPFLWSQIFLPVNLFTNKKVDVFFSPAHYAPRFCPVPSVVTIHDLSFIYYPDDFLKEDLVKLNGWTRYSVNNARSVIAVSKNTKRDILRNYHLAENKVHVIYNGITHGSSKSAEPKNLVVNGRYLLYVGTLQPRKNIETLIESFAMLKKKIPDLKLVIAGKRGWLYEKIFESARENNLSSDILFTDYLKREELVWLYKKAECLVLPSFYEGFGLPILEAMTYDCPVIASYSSSLPEIGGDACIYFDPKNALELSDKINHLLIDKNLKKTLINKGRERARLYSWKKCAEQTLKLLIDSAGSA